MKPIITGILLFATMAMTGQAAVGMQITQDGKLAVYKNDGHGNKAFTTDITIKSVWQGYAKEYGYMVVVPKYEYADLSGGAYQRFGFELGFSFFTDLYGLEITPLIGAGYGLRWGERWLNFEYSLEFKIPIIENISGIVLVNGNQRNDLNKFIWNIGYGIRYDFGTD